MKKKSTKTGIVVAILMLAVGFAAVTTQLFINGTIRIKSDVEGFQKDVVFADVDVDETSKLAGTTAELSEDEKTITLTTHVLKSIDETVTLSYKINNKSQYGAVIGGLNCTSEDDAYATYLEVTPANGFQTTYNADSPLLANTKTENSDTVTIRMKRSYVGEEGTTESTTKAITFSCTMNVDGAE